MKFEIGDKVKVKNVGRLATGTVMSILEEDRFLGGNLPNPTFYKGDIEVELHGEKKRIETYSPSFLEKI